MKIFQKHLFRYVAAFLYWTQLPETIKKSFKRKGTFKFHLHLHKNEATRPNHRDI